MKHFDIYYMFDRTGTKKQGLMVLEVIDHDTNVSQFFGPVAAETASETIPPLMVEHMGFESLEFAEVEYVGAHFIYMSREFNAKGQAYPIYVDKDFPGHCKVCRDKRKVGCAPCQTFGHVRCDGVTVECSACKGIGFSECVFCRKENTEAIELTDFAIALVTTCIASEKKIGRKNTARAIELLLNFYKTEKAKK